MSDQFLEYAKRNGYIETRIVRRKTHDTIYTKTTERTGYPNIKTIILTLRHHIEECPPEHFSQLLMSLEDRAIYQCGRLFSFKGGSLSEHNKWEVKTIQEACGDFKDKEAEK